MSADAVWRALSDPTRRAILDLLAEAPRTTGELCAAFAKGSGDTAGIGRTGVLKHIGVLTEAGLVLVRRDGRTRWNHLNPVPIQEVCDRWVSRHVRGLASSLKRLERLAEEESRSPSDRTRT